MIAYSREVLNKINPVFHQTGRGEPLIGMGHVFPLHPQTDPGWQAVLVLKQDPDNQFQGSIYGHAAMAVSKQRQIERGGFDLPDMLENTMQGFIDPFASAGRVLGYVHDNGPDFIPLDSKRTQFIGRKIVEFRIQTQRMHYYWE